MCAPQTLTILSTLVGVGAQIQQANAQASALEANAQTAERNARIANRQAENTADKYAQEQEALRERLKLVKGTAAAQAGAGGIDGSAGSALDILSSSYDAFEKDSTNLLSNQRFDVWGKQMESYNYKEEAKNLRWQAGVAKQAGNIGAFGTLLGGAATYYGLPKKIKVPRGAGG